MVGRDEVLSHVAHLIESDSLRASPTLTRFLQFCVSRALADDNENLKESTIGILCFGRTPGYDTKADPIVRVSARRLRVKLNLFYEREGADSTIRIEIPKGAYVPVFRRCNAPVLVSTACDVSVPTWVESHGAPVLAQQGTASGIRTARYSWLLVLLVALLSFLQVHGRRPQSFTPESSSSVSVEEATSTTVEQQDLSRLPNAEESASGGFDTTETSSPASVQEASGHTSSNGSITPRPQLASTDAYVRQLRFETKRGAGQLRADVLSLPVKQLALDRTQNGVDTGSVRVTQQEAFTPGRSTATHFWSAEPNDAVDRSIGSPHGRPENVPNGLSSTFEPHF